MYGQRRKQLALEYFLLAGHIVLNRRTNVQSKHLGQIIVRRHGKDVLIQQSLGIAFRHELQIMAEIFLGGNVNILTVDNIMAGIDKAERA